MEGYEQYGSKELCLVLGEIPREKNWFLAITLIDDIDLSEEVEERTSVEEDQEEEIRSGESMWKAGISILRLRSLIGRYNMLNLTLPLTRQTKNNIRSDRSKDALTHATEDVSGVQKCLKRPLLNFRITAVETTGVNHL